MSIVLILLCGFLSTAVEAEPQKAVVIVPVADVWSRPLEPGTTGNDDWRETQVLFGEKVLIHESSGPWVRIEAVEQMEFTHHNRWEGYPGWVWKTTLELLPSGFDTTLGDYIPPPNAIVTANWLSIMDQEEKELLTKLPLGSVISSGRIGEVKTLVNFRNGRKAWAIGAGLWPWTHQTTRKFPRTEILRMATLLLGIDYLWGGLTPGNPPPSPTPSPPKGGEGTRYGVDCSGLVHLAYRVNGTQIPRDSHEQWMKAKPIKRAELKPADLIFSAKADNPKKITHVALYAGDNQIIEAPQTGMVVRKISFKEKYGKDLNQIESGDASGDRVLYFGSYLSR